MKYYDQFLDDQPPIADNLHFISPKPIKIPQPPEQLPDGHTPVNTPLPPPDKPTIAATARSQIVLAYVAFTRIFSRWGSEFIEFQSALTAAILGTWLMFPPGDVAGEFYEALNRLAPPLLLGSIVMLIGVVQLVALISHHWKLRRLTALTACALWIFFSVLFAMSGLAPGTPAFAVLAFLSMWVYLKLGRFKL